MIRVQWSTTAFAVLEALPQSLAFEILERTDKLASFPEMGSSLKHLYPKFGNCRQLIFKRRYRVTYLCLATEAEVSILSLQHCRQQLPTTIELHLFLS